MELGEIIGDALVYPLHNIKSLVIFILIGVIAGVLGGASLLGMVASISGQNVPAAEGFGILGVIIAIIGVLLISGYTLDVVKYGIARRQDGPGIDPVRQISNAIKVLVVNIVYYIIPVIIAWLLGFLLGKGVLTILITIIFYVVFALAQYMATCRLAKYDSLGAGLAIGEAIGDISRVGILKLLLTILIVFVIAIVFSIIIGAIMNWNNTVGGILLGIFGVYFVFFYNRAIGLLYSDV